MNEGRRIYFLDNLKSIVIFFVIVHHAALAYLSHPVAAWGIADVRKSYFFDIFVAWNDAFIMPLMFFISGYFGLASLVKHPGGAFLRGKGFRIGWPWLTGLVFLAPVTMAVAHPELYRGVLPFLADFWTRYFNAQQYWYLNVLLWFYLVLMGVVRVFPGWRRRAEERTAERPGREGIGFFAGLGLLAFGGLAGANGVLPDGAWLQSPLLSVQYVRVPLYLLFFLCGALAWKRRWFEEYGYAPDVRWWGAMWAVASAAYAGLRLMLNTGMWTIPPGAAMWADQGIRAGLCVVSTFALLALFRRFADRTGPFWRVASACAFAVYWIQQPVVTIFGRMTTGWEAPVFLKFATVTAETALVSYGLAYGVLLRIPFFAPGKKG